ncbi:cytochrome P450 [Calidifontibacter sp. DB0510]|uniref:Cytochrome P450 n=1 Tax=Metallococcus carri TaxID=1656884 RepID=A0A967E9C4_9MICO|nr:cytochrome P450 [Metallococcus carri]NHN56222.1 cytochrome P450 [Metallococcus carri]NOP38727.1 cytochrome P450 [Calidifontibacter sp. DB2511S]
MTDTTYHAASTELPHFDDDPFGPELLEDPHPFHARLRDSGPVAYLERYGVFALGRYEQVRAALSDWQSFISGAGVGLANFRTETPWRPPSLLLEADPPHHDAPRAVLTSVLSSRALRGLRDQWFADPESLVDDLVKRGGELDAVSELAEVFPLRVFPDAVGLAKDGRENLLPYGSHAFNAFGPRNALVQDGEATIGAVAEWIGEQCARDRLAPGGFGEQIWRAADRGDITAEQAPLIVRSLLTAGVDTTVNGISAVLSALARNPEQYELMRRRPELIRVAFDEAVRFESPVQTFFRVAEQDVSLGGTVIPAGSKVLMFLGSANRDPRRWVQPDRFDLQRDPSGHVGFGMGIHQCAGQHIARLEAEALLTALVRRVRRIELTGTPRRKHNNTLRSWGYLPLRLTEA